MKAVKKFALVLSFAALSGVAASAASTEERYLKSCRKDPGIPVPVKVVAPDIADAPEGAEAMIAFVVDIAGLPRSVTVADTTHEGLALAAVEAVKQWRFTPVVRDGVTVDTKVLLPVRATEGSLFGPRFASN